MTRAAIYTRLSHDADGLSSSTADQERECRAECKRRGWYVVEVFSDNDVPASEAQAYRVKPRKAYARLLNAVKAGEVDAIVSWATDRLYRHPVDLEDLIRLAQEHGVRFATLSGEVKLDTADGIAYARIGAAMNAAEVAKIRARVRRKHRAKAEAGEWQGGRRPFGYVAVKGHLEVVDAEANAIREAAASLLNGGSLNSVTRRWNDLGLTTTDGNPCTPGGVRAVMLSPRIAGLRAHEGQTVTAKWRGILTRRDFRRLERLLADPARRRGTTYRARYLLTGLAKCGICGGPITGRPRDRVPNYICKATGRVHLAVKAESVDDMVMHAAEGMLLDVPIAVADPATLSAPLLADRERVEADLERLGARFGDISEIAFHAAERALSAKLAAIDAELDAISPQRPVDAFLAQFDRFEVSTDVTANARAWLESLVEVVVVNPARVPGLNRFDPSRVEIVWRVGVRSVADTAFEWEYRKLSL